MAITGPFTRADTSSSTVYLYRNWYRQLPPFRAPLPFKMVKRVYYRTPWDVSGTPSALSYDVWESPVQAEAYNKAYSKFKESVGEAASLAVNVAERKQAMDAMAKRVTQVYRFARALKSFRFGEAARALELVVVSETKTSVRVKRSNHSKNSSWDRMVAKEQRKGLNARHVPDDAPVSGQMHKVTRPRYRKEDDSWELTFKRNASHYGSNYLEYHFGWEPLMKDIQASFDLFTDPMRDKRGLLVVARGFAKSDILGHSTGDYSVWYDYYWRTSVAIRGRVKITNLDLYRLEQLGMLNPAVLAWELVPFSFVVDWFTNIGDVLASYTDFFGLEIIFGQSTVVSKITESQWYRTNYYGPWANVLVRSYGVFSLKRTVGISGPTLAMKPIKALSVTRILTASSLLTGFFGTVQHRR